MEDILQQISNLGFPIILSMYLLMRIEAKMEELTKSIQRLSIVLDKDEKT
ncbi:MAG: YvrJ family protein [Cellulosilyticaceae bacterium]